MSQNALSVDGSQEHLYREMKLSQGGVMLLVRLQASLLAESQQTVACFASLSSSSDPSSLLQSGSRLSVTYDWLKRQFGPANATRALIETAREVLEA
ncbi:MAG: hypothetical protein ABIS18_00865 [Actinomycetota bacterium]